jgi:hypothetical protein
LGAFEPLARPVTTRASVAPLASAGSAAASAVLGGLANEESPLIPDSGLAVDARRLRATLNGTFWQGQWFGSQGRRFGRPVRKS